MIDGILLIDKEKDISSFFVIKKLKGALGKGHKIGHGGTLDPFATGLLIVLFGKATKKMNDIHALEKEYEVMGEFGYATDTQDTEGEKIHTIENIPVISKESIEKCIQENFLGEISQLPPIYSAKKTNGQRSYDLARQGLKPVLTPKHITVSTFEVIKYEWPKVEFRIVCSTGTYVRTLINDLGEKVGTYATAISLRRTRIGKFEVKDAFKSESITPLVVSSIMELDKVKI